MKQTLSSVLAQTVRDFRVIVSDDASEPDTALAVERYVQALGETRVSYRYHPKNLKEFDHNRFLFGQCSESFFAILHDDDLWDPDFLERCLAVLRGDPSLACVTANQYIIDVDGVRDQRMTTQYEKRMGRDRYPEGRVEILESLMAHSFFTLSSSVFRTAALKSSALVDPELHGNAGFDLNLFLRLGERGAVGHYLAEPSAAYRVHDERLTVTEERAGFNPHLLETLMALLEKRQFSRNPEKQRRRILSALYHNYAMVRYVRGDSHGLYRYMWKCLETAPSRWQNWAYAVLAAFPFLIRPVLGSRLD